MKAFNQASRVDPELLTDPTEGNSVQIVHDGSGGHELIAVEIFRYNSGGWGLEDSSAMGTIFSRKPIEDGFCLQRVTLQD